MSYYSATILADSPTAYYRMDEVSGTVAHDLSGNGYNAALSGATLSQTGAISSDSDTSILFTSAGGLSLPYTLNITSWSTFGMEFWIELAGVWEYVGVDWNGTTVTVYRNGEMYTPDASAPTSIDQGFYWAGSVTSGNLDEIAIFPRLTSLMALRHYNAGLNTPTSIQVQIAGVSYTIKANTLQIVDALAQRSTCTFTVEDATGNVFPQYGQQVTVTELNGAGLLYAGYVFDATPVNLTPNVNNEIAITCMDQHYLADKHVMSDKYEKTNLYAGVIATHLLKTYLAQEGVTANYAYRNDTTNTDWNSGTLSNTTGTLNVGSGDLELSLAGSIVTKSETTTANFAAGTLTGVQAGSNALTLIPQTATQFQSTCLGYNGAGGSFAKFGVWNSSYTIVAGDFLQYTVWISSTSPGMFASLDGVCSDGTTIGNAAPSYAHQVRDQNGLWASAQQDLSGYANDQWYFRTIDLTPIVGKTLYQFFLSFAGTAKGQYNAYFFNMQVYNNNTLTQNVNISTANGNGLNIILLNNLSQQGYTGTTASVVTAYNPVSGIRTSPATSLTSVGCFGNSLISYTATAPTTTLAGASTAAGTTVLYTSTDNVTWQPVTNYATIPSLIVGASASGVSLYFKEVLAIVGPDPTLSPTLSNVVASVDPTYVNTNTDFIKSVNTQAGWNAGTVSNLTAQSDNSLTLENANSRSWDGITTKTNNQTLYGGGSPAQTTVNRNLALTATNGNDARARFDFANKFNQLDMSILVQVPATNENIGLEFGTTTWANGLNSYAYVAYITPTQIKLSHGTNGTAGAETNITTVTFATALTVGDWHTLRVQWGQSANAIVVYLDGVQYISTTSSTYPSGGTTAYVAARFYNNSGATDQGYFATFGIVQTLTSTQYTSQSLTGLGGVGTVGDSRLFWAFTQPQGAAISAQVSINGGAYTATTNGAAIAGLTNGLNVTGQNMKVRFIFNSTDPTLQPVLLGYTVWVSSQYNASGTRVSPALSLASVGRVGNSVVAWNVNLPGSGTTLKVETSPTGSGSWTDVTASNGGTITGEYIQPAPQFDYFNVNSSASYTQTNLNGGHVAAWTWDTANSRLTAVQTTGIRGYLQYTGFTRADMYAEADFSVSDSAGLIVRQVDASNCYFLVIADASSASQTTNTVQIKKMVAGTISNIGSAVTINFPRNTFHRFRLDVQGSQLTVLMDGTQLTQQTDTSVTAAGNAGILASIVAGDILTCYSLRIQPYGDTLSGNIYTRCTLTSTDPTNTPQVLDLTVAAYNPNMGVGSLIPVTSYSLYTGAGNTTSIASCFDDLALKSTNFWWQIDRNKVFYFQQRTGTPAPFPVASVNTSAIAGFSGLNTNDFLVKNLSIKNSNPAYRNKQWIVGGVDSAVQPQTFVGDGSTQSWPLAFPVAGPPAPVPVVSVNGVTQLVGIQGQTSGLNFYYQVGSQTLTQDHSNTPLVQTQILSITYYGTVPVQSMAQDTTEQTAYAVLEGESGIVEVVESFPGLNKAASDALATSRLNQYKVRGRTFKFDTLHSGLKPGQIVPVFCPALGANNAQCLVNSVTTNIVSVASVNGYLPMYSLEVIEGPVLGDWSRFAAAPYKPRKTG